MCKVDLRQANNIEGVFYYLPLRLLPAERIAANAESITIPAEDVPNTIGQKFPRTNAPYPCPLRIIFVSPLA